MSACYYLVFCVLGGLLTWGRRLLPETLWNSPLFVCSFSHGPLPRGHSTGLLQAPRQAPPPPQTSFLSLPHVQNNCPRVHVRQGGGQLVM